MSAVVSSFRERREQRSDILVRDGSPVGASCEPAQDFFSARLFVGSRRWVTAEDASACGGVFWHATIERSHDLYRAHRWHVRVQRVRKARHRRSWWASIDRERLTEVTDKRRAAHADNRFLRDPPYDRT